MNNFFDKKIIRRKKCGIGRKKLFRIFFLRTFAP